MRKDIQVQRLLTRDKDLEELAEFLVKAKTNTYAGNGRKVKSQRPGFKELVFKDGNWEYRDSYTGFYCAPGQEIVRFKKKPIWHMAYSGGMSEEYIGDLVFAKKTFEFLKEVLRQVSVEMPFRGPRSFETEEWGYYNEVKGNITGFSGHEEIIYVQRKNWGPCLIRVFDQDYIGGLIVDK